MIRWTIRKLLRFTLRIYFRRIEVAGLVNVPADSPIIFVLNHPNALVDPAFLLCLAPRPVSFLAKAPLFRIPVIGYLIRALDSLPVYRRQDEGEDVARNFETFEAARNLLTRGGTIGICPEGVSHDETRLKPVKSGAARIALGAVSSSENMNLQIIPVGLYYTQKTMFRSSALLYFGKPLAVQRVALGSDGALPRQAVRELSQSIERAMREVILEAEHGEALSLIERAEKIFSADEVNQAEAEQSLTRELELRRRFVEGYAFHRANSPARIAALVALIARFENELSQAGIDPSDLSLPKSALRTVLNLTIRVLVFVLAAPLALAGAFIHYPAYRLGGYLSKRLSHDAEDVLSTFKIASATLFFPLTWAIVALLLWRLEGGIIAGISLVVTPVCGYLAVRLFEEIDSFNGNISALNLFIMRRRSFVRLLAERALIRKEILALGTEDAPPTA
jgi:glycerol-3-phosphate O-acyltransferase / dihydroxyacetone phosphate acyltransferase